MFRSKFTVYADYEHLAEKEFSMPIILSCYTQVTMDSFSSWSLDRHDVTCTVHQRSVLLEHEIIENTVNFCSNPSAEVLLPHAAARYVHGVYFSPGCTSF